MTTVASQITSLTSVYSIVYSDAFDRKHQSSTSLAFVWGIPRTNGQSRGKCFHLMTSSWSVLPLVVTDISSSATTHTKIFTAQRPWLWPMILNSYLGRLSLPMCVPNLRTISFTPFISKAIKKPWKFAKIKISKFRQKLNSPNIKAPRHWPLCGEFPAQMASNAENVSIWWRHHVNHYLFLHCHLDVWPWKSETIRGTLTINLLMRVLNLITICPVNFGLSHSHHLYQKAGQKSMTIRQNSKISGRSHVREENT